MDLFSVGRLSLLWSQSNVCLELLQHFSYNFKRTLILSHIRCSLLFFLSLRFKNVMFDISPTEEVGDFEVKAKFMGVEMEKVQLHFQVNISLQKTHSSTLNPGDKWLNFPSSLWTTGRNSHGNKPAQHEPDLRKNLVMCFIMI